LEAFVEWLRARLSRVQVDEDKPLEANEVDELIDHTASALGWSRTRVLAEAILRLHSEVSYAGEKFEPLTPPEKPRSKPPMRRLSSVRALVLGLPKR
jgi:hypothetical protein